MIRSSLITLFPNGYMNNILPDKYLFCHPGHDKFSILPESNYIIKLTAVTHKFIFAQAVTDKAFFTIHIQLRIGSYHLCCLDCIKCCNLGFALFSFAVFLQEALEVLDSIFRQMLQIISHLFQLSFNSCNLFIRLEGVVFRYSFNPDFSQSLYILFGDIPMEI